MKEILFFMGSGTTAEAAIRLGRKVVGFELKSNYVEIAAQRLNNHYEEEAIRESQTALFG